MKLNNIPHWPEQQLILSRHILPNSRHCPGKAVGCDINSVGLCVPPLDGESLDNGGSVKIGFGKRYNSYWAIIRSLCPFVNSRKHVGSGEYAEESTKISTVWDKQKMLGTMKK